MPCDALTKLGPSKAGADRDKPVPSPGTEGNTLNKPRASTNKRSYARCISFCRTVIFDATNESALYCSKENMIDSSDSHKTGRPVARRPATVFSMESSGRHLRWITMREHP